MSLLCPLLDSLFRYLDYVQHGGVETESFTREVESLQGWTNIEAYIKIYE